jgi:hypothetical protein
VKLRLLQNVIGACRSPIRTRTLVARRARGALAVVSAAALVAAMVAVAMRATDSGREGAEARRMTPHVLARGSLRLTIPSGWVPAADAPRLPGMDFARPPIALVHRVSSARVVAGILPATSRSLLPAEFLAGVRGRLPAGERVMIGGRLDARHYAGVTHSALAGLLDVYVAPSTEGVVTVACLADAVSALLHDCWTAVSRVSLSRGRAVALGPHSAFRQVLLTSIRALDAAEAVARRRLSTASTPQEQAQAVAQLPRAYGGAAAALAPLASPSPAARGVIDALQQAQRASAGFERSLRRADRTAFDGARRRLRHHRARFERLVDRILTPES